MSARFAEVAAPVPLRRLFTYAIPDALVGRVQPGSRVAVSFAGRKVPAVVVRLLDAEPAQPEGEKRFAIKPLAGLLEREPIFDAELLAFLAEAASYYLHPIGEVMRTAAPALPSDAVKALRGSGFIASADELAGPRVRTQKVLYARRVAEVAIEGRLGPKQRELLALLETRGEVPLPELVAHTKSARSVLEALAARGLVALSEREVASDRFFARSVERDEPKAPHPAQAAAIDAISGSVRAREAATYLLHGVTGSGKTEVYLRVIAEARAAGRGAMLLVPEIALTPQLVGRFRARFGDDIAVLHSGLSDRERDAAWRALRSGSITLAVGARSALFAPVQDLAVIVVDEEHDPSYKQEEGFRYHARDLAILRAHRAGAVCVLGSATPSLESFHAAREGRYRLLELPTRPDERPMPEVEIVDLARSYSGPSHEPLLTGPLHKAIEKCLREGGQCVLFLNRRGFSPSLRCAACGHVEQCPECSVALTEHRRAGLLRCHTCDYATGLTQVCSACGAPGLTPIGVGTEKLEDAIARVFAPARVARLDRDVAAGAGIEDVLDRVRRREVDILVGTQMVTKGHDLPGVTLVGVLLADQSLAFPDFRASERTFQLLTQVAGRAGRADQPGRVILQTFQPAHYAVRAAQRHSFAMFVEAELPAREDLGYAPFGRLVAIRIDSRDAAIAKRAAELVAEAASAHPSTRGGVVRVLGPAPAPIERLRARWRWRVFLRGADRKALRSVALAVIARIDAGLGPDVRASVDVDPVSMM